MRLEVVHRNKVERVDGVVASAHEENCKVLIERFADEENRWRRRVEQMSQGIGKGGEKCEWRGCTRKGGKVDILETSVKGCFCCCRLYSSELGLNSMGVWGRKEGIYLEDHGKSRLCINVIVPGRWNTSKPKR